MTKYTMPTDNAPQPDKPGRSRTKALALAAILLLAAGFFLFFFRSPSHKKASVFDNKSDMAEENQKLAEYLISINNRETGMFESFVGSAHFIEDVRYEEMPMMKTAKGYLDDQAFTYDQALAIIALLNMGQADKAREMLNIYEANFGIPKNGYYGLFTSYMCDKFDYYFPSPSGEFNTLILGIDGDRIHVGPVMWVGIAAQHHFYKTKSAEFVDFIIKMFLWARELPHYKLKDGSDGSVCMGHGWGVPWEKVFSTENILDYYSFLQNLHAMIKADDDRVIRNMQINNISVTDVEEEIRCTERWFKEVGYNKRGTFSRGGFGPTDDGKYTIDELDVLDVNSWAFTAIGPANLERLGIDPFKLAENAESRFGVSVFAQGKKYSGFDFGSKESYSRKRSEPLIWWEGTGHMVVAYKVLADYAYEKQDKNLAYWLFEKHKFYLNEMTRFSDDLIQRDSGQLPYVSKLLSENEISYVFDDWWPIARSEHAAQKITPASVEGKYVISIASTLWRYFGAAGLNPFDAPSSAGNSSR